MKHLNKILIALLILLGILQSISLARINLLQEEKNTYKSNTNALLSNMKRMQIDSTTTATDVNVLKLTLNEYKQYREKDLEEIKKLNIRLKDIQSIAKQKLEIKAPIDAAVRDSVIIRDTVLLKIQTVEMCTPHIQITGIIENAKLRGNIHLPVNLNQTCWIKYKHRFLFWKWGRSELHQTITVDNPYVKINYSEVVVLRK